MRPPLVGAPMDSLTSRGSKKGATRHLTYLLNVETRRVSQGEVFQLHRAA